jgi:branched-chain amino acid transport system permease protein
MAVSREFAAGPHFYIHAQTRWQPIEFAFWVATLLPFLLFPNHLALASQIAITALFALSLDLILGYAGIVSLGHAAFFGVGAYTAGLITKSFSIILFGGNFLLHFPGWREPLIGLVAGGLMAGLLGYATSFIIAHFRHLALIMITLGLGLLVHEAANSASWLTGGSDGLQGVRIGPLLGRFSFDLYGYTAYTYSLAVLFLVFLITRRLVNSPFGLSLRGIRENPVRMPAIGASSPAHIRKIYTISAVIAGIAGAVLAQTTSTVSLGVLDFQRSADVLVILILGGAGRLYGGLLGAIIYMVARDQFSGINPQYWYFWIGMLLVLVVMFLPNGILGGLSQLASSRRTKELLERLRQQISTWQAKWS